MKKNDATGLKRVIKQLIHQINDTTNLWSLISLLAGQYINFLYSSQMHTNECMHNTNADVRTVLLKLFLDLTICHRDVQTSKSSQHFLHMLLAHAFSGNQKN